MLFAATLGAALPAVAGNVTFDGSLPGTSAGVLAPLNQTFTIDQARGRVNGANLFHSFSQFTIDAGEKAVFQSSDAIANILARVTGGMPTTINGTLSVANDAVTSFWLLNPAGIVVGETGVLDVRGAVALGTADFVRFTNGRLWRTVPGPWDADVTLSVDPDVMDVGPDSTARGVVIHGDHLAPAGDDTLASGYAWLVFGSEVSISSDGDLHLDGGQIVTRSLPSGDGRIDILAQNDIGMHGTQVLGLEGAAHAGDIHMRGRDVTIANESNVWSSGSGAAGSGAIQIDARNLYLNTGSALISDTSGAGPGRDITVNVTGEALLQSGGQLISQASSEGNGGSIHVTAPKLILDSSDLEQRPSALFGVTLEEGTGKGGDIDLDVGTLEMTEGSGLVALSFGSGRSGDVRVHAENGLFMSGAFIDAEGDAGGFGPFDGVPGGSGVIDITIGRGGTLRAANSSEISSGTVAASSGNVTITLDGGALEVLDGSQIRSSVVRGGASGGDVRIDANGSSISIVRSNIDTEVLENGNGGNIIITGAGRTLLQSGGIFAESGQGNGGNITLTTAPGGLVIQDSLSIISAQARRGINGRVAIDSPNTDLNATMQPQDVDVSRPAALASNACVPSRGITRSTLVRQGKGGSSGNAGTYLTMTPSKPEARSELSAHNAAAPGSSSRVTVDSSPADRRECF